MCHTLYLYGDTKVGSTVSISIIIILITNTTLISIFFKILFDHSPVAFSNLVGHEAIHFVYFTNYSFIPMHTS